MVRRLLSLVVLLGGCWSDEPLVHDAFTPAQWTHLQELFPPVKRPAACDQITATTNCDEAARFGQQLFFEPRLSGPPPGDPSGIAGGKTSCATCHATNPGKDEPLWYSDVRSSNAVSQGAAGPTPHNTMTLVNLYGGDRTSFGWTGECVDRPCQTPTDVVEMIALPKAMKSTTAIVAGTIRSTPAYVAAFQRAFGTSVPSDDARVQQFVEVALDAYMRTLISGDAPFDRFMAGKDDPRFGDDAVRGFALFVGRAMCAECHYGRLLSDDSFHVTGVADPGPDDGQNGTGAFYTAPLRQIVKTAPYMHKGTQHTLADVITFYHWGGDSGGYWGDKDRLMQPFDITNDEAQDLTAFLETLTGDGIDKDLRADTHVILAQGDECFRPTGSAGLWCNGACADPGTDENNCGGCGVACDANAGEACWYGMCAPTTCTPPATLCNGSCVDLMGDPANCGGCAHPCAGNQICSAGTCVP